MPAIKRAPRPGETVFGGGAGVMFLGRGSKPSPKTQTPRSPDLSSSDSREPTAEELARHNKAMEIVGQRLGVTLTLDNLSQYPGAGLEVSNLTLDLMHHPDTAPPEKAQ